MFSWIIKFLATGFFVGYSKLVPGTLGTLLAVLLYLIMPSFSPSFYWILILILILGGTFICHRAEKLFDEFDSPRIVIDEICGYFITMAFLEKRIITIVLGFILFRFLDVVKVFPSRKLQKISGGFGIMIDDIYAGMLTNLFLHIIFRGQVFAFF